MLPPKRKRQLFKTEISTRLNMETAILNWTEPNGQTKTATFRNEGCKERALAKMRRLERLGCTVEYIQV